MRMRWLDGITDSMDMSLSVCVYIYVCIYIYKTIGKYTLKYKASLYVYIFISKTYQLLKIKMCLIYV